jgi:mannose-6-phosphate isomerase
MRLYPLKFQDIFLDKIWGGDAMRLYLEKGVSPGAKIGESWELSEHRSGESLVKEGSFKGQSLSQVVRQHPEAILGKSIAHRFGKIPLLVKFIDAQDRLSIQVHPDDAYAQVHEKDFGKTEAWVVVHACPGAKIICGLKRPLTQDEIERAIAKNSLETMLNEFEVKAGDCIFVPAGTVHAIGAGVLIYEIQEVSDVTYRLYDWGRLGDDGKPRGLHVETALKVMHYADTEDHRTIPVRIKSKGYEREFLTGCSYFVLEKYYITGEAPRNPPDRFEILTAISGQGTVVCERGEYPVQCGETVLLPAEAGAYRIRGDGPGFTCLLAWVPESREAAVRELSASGVSIQALKKLGGLS